MPPLSTCLLINPRISSHGFVHRAPTTVLIALLTHTPSSLSLFTLCPPSLVPPPPAPPPRYGHTMTTTRQYIVMFGGIVAAGQTNELWLYDTTLVTWTLVRARVSRPG